MKKSNQKTQRVTLFIKPSVVKQAKTQAIVEDLSLSGLTEGALINYLPKKTIIRKAGIMKKALLGGLGVVFVIFLLFSIFTITASACDEGCPTPTPTEAPCPEECPCGEDCPTPTPTPTEAPVATPTPTNTPVATPTPTGIPIVTPTETPAPISTPPPGNGGGGGGSPGGPAACVPSIITTIPIIIESKRIDANTIFVSWGPYAGLNKFVLQYGFQKDDLRFNTKVTGFSTTIGSLPSNQQIFVRVAATDNCAIGAYGSAVSVQGRQAVLGVSFPSAGFEPQNILLNITLPAGLIGILSYSLWLIKKKKTFLS